MMVVHCNDPTFLEKLFHTAYDKYRKSGEWFDLPEEVDYVFWNTIKQYGAMIFHEHGESIEDELSPEQEKSAHERAEEIIDDTFPGLDKIMNNQQQKCAKEIGVSVDKIRFG